MREWSFVENRCSLADRHQPFVDPEEGDIHMILLSGLHPIPLLHPTSSIMVVTFPSASYLVEFSTANSSASQNVPVQLSLSVFRLDAHRSDPMMTV
jgi:hypothetical protein